MRVYIKFLAQQTMTKAIILFAVSGPELGGIGGLRNFLQRRHRVQVMLMTQINAEL
jgi:hypothetical protein